VRSNTGRRRFNSHGAIEVQGLSAAAGFGNTINTTSAMRLCSSNRSKATLALTSENTQN